MCRRAINSLPRLILGGLTRPSISASGVAKKCSSWVLGIAKVVTKAALPIPRPARPARC